MQPDYESLYATNITDDWANFSMIPTQAGQLIYITPWFFIKVTIGTSVLLVTLLGNILVIYVFATKRKLRTYTHYYLVGLAVADLISGGIMPALENVSWITDTWPFGEALCTTGVYINHIFLHATFLMTLTICVDRYRALTMPLKHLREKTLRHALFMISLCYLVPFCIWTPLIIILPYSGVTDRILPPLCYGSYGNHFQLLVFAIAVMSWIPMLLTILLYIFVFRAVLRGRRYEKYETRDNHHVSVNSEVDGAPRLVRQLHDAGLGNEEAFGKGQDAQSLADDPGQESRSSNATRVSTSRIVHEISNRGYQNGLENETAFHDVVRSQERRASYSREDKTASKTHCSSVVSSRYRRRLASLRATRTLTYILVVMVASALPWSIFAFWGVLNPRTAPGISQFKIMSWLVHLSSAANPFCYAVCNPLFKRAFLHVLCCGRQGH